MLLNLSTFIILYELFDNFINTVKNKYVTFIPFYKLNELKSQRQTNKQIQTIIRKIVSNNNICTFQY